MSKSISTETLIKKTLNIGAYLLRKPNVRITGEYKSAHYFSQPTRGYIAKIAFGYDTDHPDALLEKAGCSFSEEDLRTLAAEFLEIADYLKEKNAGN